MEDGDFSALMEHFEPAMLMKIVFCQLSVEEVNAIVDKVGKVVIDIGDGLTLLHQAAQFDRPDLIHCLVERGHPVEVNLNII
jgi:hypothetical protein